MSEKRMKQSDVDLIVIHCSATGPSQDIGLVEIDREHRAKGWFNGAGYHLIIRRDGMIEWGVRHPLMPGAHAEGYNEHSFGVCLVGGAVEGNPNRGECNFTHAQIESLKAVLDFLVHVYPNARVLGHRDLPGVRKDCPSFNVLTYLTKGEVVFK